MFHEPILFSSRTKPSKFHVTGVCTVHRLDDSLSPVESRSTVFRTTEERFPFHESDQFVQSATNSSEFCATGDHVCPKKSVPVVTTAEKLRCPCSLEGWYYTSRERFYVDDETPDWPFSSSLKFRETRIKHPSSLEKRNACF